MTSYRVTVTREDGWWVAVVDGLPPHLAGATDIERFADLDVEVRDLVAGLTDADPDGFGLAWRYVFGDVDVTEQIDRFQATEAEYQGVARARDRVRTTTLRALVDTGLSQAAIGDVLGLSHQRIHQLVKTT